MLNFTIQTDNRGLAESFYFLSASSQRTDALGQQFTQLGAILANNGFQIFDISPCPRVFHYGCNGEHTKRRFRFLETFNQRFFLKTHNFAYF